MMAAAAMAAVAAVRFLHPSFALPRFLVSF